MDTTTDSFTAHICYIKVIELKNVSQEKHPESGWQCEVLLGLSSQGLEPEAPKPEQHLIGLTEVTWKDPPFWSEEIHSQIGEGEVLTINLYKISKKKNSRKLYASKQVDWTTVPQAKPNENWHTLTDRKEREVEEEIRLNLQHQEIVVLPKENYQKLLDILFAEDLSVVSTLGLNPDVSPKDRTGIAELLCNVSISLKHDVRVLSHLLCTEILSCKDETVLFRGNSVGTKGLDYYFKVFGQNMLKFLLPLIDSILHEDKRTEISQTKMDPVDILDENLANLQTYLDEASSIILGPEMTRTCPPSIREVLRNMREATKKQFPEANAIYTALSGFVFLRFFVPAIMTPKLFGLSSVLFDGNANRTCTLIATVLQKMGNLQEFEPREAHFDKLNPYIKTETPKVKKILDLWAEGPASDGFPNPHLELDLYLSFSKLLPSFRTYQAIFDAAAEEHPSIAEFYKELAVFEKALETGPKPPIVVKRKLIDPPQSLEDSGSPVGRRKRLKRSLSANRKKGSILSASTTGAERSERTLERKDSATKENPLSVSQSPTEKPKKGTIRLSSPKIRATLTGDKYYQHSYEKVADAPVASPRGIEQLVTMFAPAPPPKQEGPRILRIHFPKGSKEEIPLADLDPELKLTAILEPLCKARDMNMLEYIAEDMSGKSFFVKNLSVLSVPKDEFCFLRKKPQTEAGPSRQERTLRRGNSVQKVTDAETNSLMAELLMGSTTTAVTTSPGGTPTPSPAAAAPASPPANTPQAANPANPQMGMNPQMMGMNPQMGMWGMNPQMMGMNPQMMGMGMWGMNPQMMGMNPQMMGMNPQMWGMNPQMMNPSMLVQMGANGTINSMNVCCECGIEANPSLPTTVKIQFQPERIYHSKCLKCSRCKKAVTETNHYIIGNKFLTCGACYQTLVIQFNAAQSLGTH